MSQGPPDSHDSLFFGASADVQRSTKASKLSLIQSRTGSPCWTGTGTSPI